MILFYYYQKKRGFHSKIDKLYIFVFFLISTILIEIYIFKKILLNIINKIFNNNIYNINVMKSYINHQKEFCRFPDKYTDYLYESQLELTNFSLGNISYKFYVYKKNDFISNIIIDLKNFEGHILLNCLSALKYFKDNIIS